MPDTQEKLTGKTRHRVAGIFKKKMILEVEVFIQTICPYDFSLSPGARIWRDATRNDLSELGIL